MVHARDRFAAADEDGPGIASFRAYLYGTALKHLPPQLRRPILKVDRGGQVTFHGPGQLIVYALIDLRRRNLGVRDS
jgi:lipoate-protein ligase B